MKTNIFCLVCAVLLLLTACKDRTNPPAVGDPAPDFELTALSGEKVKLSGLRGKIVLLNFWASWCPPCREEIPSLVTLNSELRARDFQMLTVALDKGGGVAIKRYFRKTGVRLPTLPDPQGSVGKDYGITGVPETFVIDRKGVIRKKVIGPMNWSDPAVIQYLTDLGALE